VFLVTPKSTTRHALNHMHNVECITTTLENASVDDTDAVATVTFFFTTDGKTFVPTFNCYLRNTSRCQMTRLLIHLSLSDVLRQPDATSSMRFSTWEDPMRVTAAAPTMMRHRDELCYM
jgi:hypothetical protein